MKLRTVMLIVVAAAMYIAVPLLFGSNRYLMSLIVASVTIGGIALAWALLGNLGGMVSFGQAAFFGVGAYVSALLTLKLGLPVFPAMLLGGVGASLSSLMMLPALRLKGPYFALVILAYAQIFRILVTEFDSLTGGSGGLSSIPPLPHVLGFDFGSKVGGYLVILTLVVVFVWIYDRTRASYYGLALRAMQESEDATRVVGVNSTLLKAMILLLSAFMTGMIGAFNAHYINFLAPDYAFDAGWTVVPIIAAIFGGYRTIFGPLVGAAAVYLIDQLIFKSLLPSGHQIVLGILLVAMILWSPTGLVPLVADKFKRRKQPATSGKTQEVSHAEA
ncbi:branched-chain amino acid ABC transporter permease [Glaciimonas sp. CA11.2]|uniref:branched-chain amino acid ABC transporter permease n=1 Tax=unclassified Glaciimonas TaxID=2644401 RepID=UPI002AB4F280|nr:MULTISPECIES: branched-chain amino acid ABC transporter permease [unclassified Glaciimonas]MDY7548016.1 branched-chain amino acid ABC transporter permease [Glaciimonas sp. CA11.2]MEB0010186.1 branched-chain amino acid ABC transporter permease [Glaciimonas sp. Cout2]MEB0084309.1 branched-chain amino acid ABC transporter permease [Glaciimonas sp. Gout2]MEB0164079.1 branched-chain amino acid ABC transporter permease [Glaciimonas sp. CA11.2]